MQYAHLKSQLGTCNKHCLTYLFVSYFLFHFLQCCSSLSSSCSVTPRLHHPALSLLRHHFDIIIIVLQHEGELSE